MKNKIISNILSLVMILNILLLTACNIIPLNTFTKLPDNKINKNTFTQKGTDPLICGESKKLGLSLSKNSIINKDGLVDNITTITTNLPLKDASVLPKFDDLKVPLSRYTPTILDYVIVIKDRTKTYEKVVPAGCTSFDWDGKDNNGVFFNTGFLTVDINFKVTRNAVTSYYNFSDFSEKFLNLTIPSEANYSPTENRKVSSYMYCSCLTAPNNLALVLNTTKASTQSGLISLVNAPPLSIFNNRDVLLGQTNSSNPNAPVFNVPLTTTLVNVSTAIGKLIAIDEPSCSFTPFLPENEINFNTEKIIQITEITTEHIDPKTNNVFEMADLDKLNEYVASLEISTDNANALYSKNQDLETYKSKKQSFTDRKLANPSNTDLDIKIEEIDANILQINSDINSLKYSVLAEVSNLNSKKDILATHVNAMTKEQYIVPYTIDEKPSGVGNYNDFFYYMTLDLTIALSDGPTLYTPDENDPNKDQLKNFWEVKGERSELFDPEKIFNATRNIYQEIQLLNDLITDYNAGEFNSSGYNGKSENIDATEEIKIIINEIKYHKDILNTRSKKFADDYYENYVKIEDETLKFKAYFALEVAEARGKIDSNDVFLLQSLRNEFNNGGFSTKNDEGFSIKGRPCDRNGQHYTDCYYAPKKTFRNPRQENAMKVLNPLFAPLKNAVSKYGGYIIDLLNYPLPEQELQTRLILGYSKVEWDKLKEIDGGKATDDLVKATMNMAAATVIYPTTYADLILGVGTFVKGIKLLKKINIKNTNSFIEQAKILKNETLKLGTNIEKQLAKTPVALKETIKCIEGFSAKSFNTKAIVCPTLISFLKKLNFKKSSFGKFSEHITGLPQVVHIPPSNIVNDLAANIIVLKGKIPNYPQNILKSIEDFKTLGIRRKAKTGFPFFDPYVVKYNGNPLSFDIGSFAGAVGKGDYIDHAIASSKPDVVSFVKSLGLLTPEKEAEYIAQGGNKLGREVRKLLNGNLQLTWHHNEDLKTMQLVPWIIHSKVGHLGGEKIASTLRGVEVAYYHYWRENI